MQRRPPQRLAFALIALCATALLACATGADPAEPERVREGGYAGLTSELGTVGLGVDATGTALRFAISYYQPGDNCPAASDFTIPLRGFATSASGLGAPGVENVTLTVRFSNDAVFAIGAYSAQPRDPGCAAKRLTWVARIIEDALPSPPVAGVPYAGLAAVADAPAGTAELRTAADGTTMSEVAIAQSSGACSVQLSLPTVAVTATGDFNSGGQGTPGRDLALVVGRFDARYVRGMFIAPPTDKACPPVAGYFAAEAKDLHAPARN